MKTIKKILWSPAIFFCVTSFLMADFFHSRSIKATPIIQHAISTFATIVGSNIWAKNSEGITIADDSGTLGLFVEDGGKVGIGTSSPSNLLHVYGSNGTARIEDTSGTARLFLKNISSFVSPEAISTMAAIAPDSGENETLFASKVSYAFDNTDGSEDGYTSFSIMADGTSTEVMRLDYDGFVIAYSGVSLPNDAYVAFTSGVTIGLDQDRLDQLVWCTASGCTDL